MLKFQHKLEREDTIPNYKNTTSWHKCPGDYVPSRKDLAFWNFKLNDVVYTRWSEDLEKALLWEQLSR